MTDGNPLRAGFAGVDNEDPTTKPPEVGCGSQACWTAADYKTVARSFLGFFSAIFSMPETWRVRNVVLGEAGMWGRSLPH